MLALLCSVMRVRDSPVQTRFIKMNESFFVSFGSFKERNEQIDSEKDLDALIGLFHIMPKPHL